ncbi:ABC transporter permease [Mycoplasma sp. 1018B]|uniref:ABC transporter permease n=1 Tax=Mycoplasma sp. 1018B TaxID=2967302 RepID=UPI00211C6809|nr:ABC transporter permease [Mycoplasma sp. 1018B]UUM19388.1 ABC transporter permease [Mycoplasma sp. 1018B]
MIKQLKNYALFLIINLIAKKILWITFIVFLVINFTLSLTLSLVNQNYWDTNLVIFVNSFIQIIFTIFYSGILYINIFKELEEEGMEILSLSKPLKRKNIYLAKTLIAIFIALIYSLIITLLNLILTLINLEIIFLYLIISFFAIFFVFIIFGTFTSLLAYKLNAKIALTIPFVITMPLIVGGILLNNQSTSKANNLAYYLNLEYKDNLAGNIANLETFYLNNKKDNFYILPNGFEKNNFTDKQKLFLEQTNNLANFSNLPLSIYSWLALPYQMMDIFNLNNKNLFTNNISNNLKQYLYYPQLDSYLYNYDLQEANLKKFKIWENENQYQKYIVPALLKNDSIFENIINTDIIYARENAESFTISFPEDEYVFSASDNLVGNIKWKYIKEILEDSNFATFINDWLEEQNNKLNLNLEKSLNKKQLLTNWSLLINDENNFLNRYQNNQVTIFNTNSISNKIIKTQIEKKIYLTVAMLYYIYFAQNNETLLEIILSNDNVNLESTPSVFKVKINNFNYYIGGFASYSAMQEVREKNNEKKIIIRYSLNKNDNYLFQPLDQIYELKRSTQVINKMGYVAIWVILSISLTLINTYLYTKKDYK